MRSEYESIKMLPSVTLKDLFVNPALRIPVIISIVVMVSQQFTGINAVIFFSTSIFEGAGLSKEHAQYATIGTGAVNVIMTLVSLVLVERAGRKTLLLGGFSGMCLSTIALTICLSTAVSF